MHENLLQSLGLSSEESHIYELMLELGVAPIQKILPKSGLKRGTLYNVLRKLVERGLLSEKAGTKKATFEVAPPAALEKLMAAEASRIEENKKRLADSLPQLQSLYNLAMHKPNVQFAEGKEGIIAQYERLLDERKPIDSIEDKGEMASFIPDYFPKFIKKRIARGIVNRVISPTTNPINTTSQKELREARAIPVAEFPFGMDVKIVGTKVSLITLKEKTAFGVLIDHPEISENFRHLFNYLWKRLGPTPQPPQSPLQPRAPLPTSSLSGQADVATPHPL